MKDIKQFVEKEVLKEFEYATSLRRYLHQNPEVSKCEFNTLSKIEDELHSFGLEVKTIEDGGIYAEIIGSKEDNINKEIVLRADIDALPIKEVRDIPYKSINNNVMHACGHDAHTASLLTAAKILARNNNLFSGKIKLCFQRGEEVGFGAKAFVNSGLLDCSDRSYAFHCWPYLNCGSIAIVPGPNNASVDYFKINVKGHAAHISVPHLGADAVLVISEIVSELHKLNALTDNPVDSILLGIGKVYGGVSYNIIAEDAYCEGTIRCYSETKRKLTRNSVEEISKKIAAKHNCNVSAEWGDYGSALINDEVASLEAQKVAIELFGKENLITNKKPSLIGDNMSDFINKVPGVYTLIGTANQDRLETTVALHDPNFDIDEDALKVAISMFVGYSIQFLNNEII